MSNQMDKAVRLYWEKFLAETGRAENTPLYEVFHFTMDEKLANELLELVLAGKKRATSSSLRAYQVQNEPLPKVGDLSIVTDWEGRPGCVIETTAVTVLPFRDMTFEICSREGEDDNLQSWQEGHIRFFEMEGKQTGYVFDWDMPVVFEDFCVIYR